MRQLRIALARIAGFFRRQDAEAELQAEMEAHLEMAIEDKIQRGLSPSEARRQALLESGGMTQAADAVREQRGLPWVESILADVRYALRALRHTPAFSLVVVITLALGIGANTAIFSVVRGVLLKPLPHRDGDRLVYLRHSADDTKNLSFSVPEVEDLRKGAPSLGGIAEFSNWFHTMQGEGDAIRIDVGLVTGNFFDILGLSPILGRLTRASDDGVGVPPVMVLTHDFWLTRFGGDSSIVGRTVRLDGNAVTVIGVLQPAPFFPGRVDALLNMVISPHHTSAMMVGDRSHRMTEVIARLAPGATLEQARKEVELVHARMRNEYTEAYDAGAHYRAAVIPFREVLGEDARVTLWLLMAAAAFVMIISTANVANLTLMRGVRREQELVIRAALGAGVRRLRRLLLIENLVLSLVGGAVGIVIAIGGVDMLTSLAERYSPRAGEIRLDTVVLGFTVALSAVVALIFSFLASLPKEGTFATMSSGGRRVSGSLRKHRLQSALVVAQIAVSVVLLAGAGLLTRTMLRLSEVDTGLETEQVLTISVPLLDPTKLNPETDFRNKQLYQQMRSEIRALPGVTEVGIGSTMPLRAGLMDFDIKVEGRTPATGAAMPHAELRTATPDYFTAAGIPLTQGRNFDAGDRAGGARVAIVNREFADRMLPGENPIGKRVAFTGEVLKFTPVSGEWRTIVGVVGNTQDGGLDAPTPMAIFSPFEQEFAILGGVVIRAGGNAADLAAAATRIVRSIVPGVPLGDVKTIAQIKDESVSPRRLNAALISSFGILAVLIAAVGIAGVLASSVSARTNEIGIRMSLGADRLNVQRMIIGEGSVLLGAGLLLGMVGAFFAARVIRGLLFAVQPHDPLTFAAVAALMAVIGIVACWIPALRAARVEPAITMRS